jgi:hypothetical protein
LRGVESTEDVLLLCVPFDEFRDDVSPSKLGGIPSSCDDKPPCVGGVGTGEMLVLVTDGEGLPLGVKVSPLLVDSCGETGTRGGLGAVGRIVASGVSYLSCAYTQ